ESPAAVGTTQQGISRARYYSAFFEDQLQTSDGLLQRPAPVTQQDDCAPPQRTTRRGTDGLHDSFRARMVTVSSLRPLSFSFEALKGDQKFESCGGSVS